MRFPEFTGEWSKHRLGDVMAFKNGLNKGKEFFGTGTPIVNYMDVNKNENIVSSMIKGVVTVTNCEIENFQIIKGDVFFTRTSETSDEIGLSASLLEEIPKGVFSGFILRGRPISGVFEPSFSGYYFRSERIRKEIIKHSSITTRALTSGSSLSQLNISIPSLEEQSKIARLLELIDKKLDSQRKLINNYETLMNEIYNCSEKESEYVLKDLVTFEKKTRRMSSEGRDSGIFAFYTNEKKQNKYIDDYDFNGEYIIANTGGQANFKYVNGAFAVMSDSLVMKIKEANTPAVYYSLLSMTQYINNVGFVGSGLKHLDKKWFSNLLIDIPNKKTIELLEKIEHNLQILKKFESNFLTLKIYLLQALFV